jgi:hypothetical protein
VEIKNLYELFSDLISNKKFMKNDFVKKSDVFAVIDLAQACTMFLKIKNHKATGVCYNNIANYQFKNHKFLLAKLNFEEAIKVSEYGIEESKSERNNKVLRYYVTVRAHRYYQKAVCTYKYLKYSQQKIENAERNIEIRRDE